MGVRHGMCRNQVWTPQRWDRLNHVALAVRTAVTLGLSTDLLRSHDVDIVRRDFVGSKRETSPNRLHQTRQLARPSWCLIWEWVDPTLERVALTPLRFRQNDSALVAL